MASPFVKQLAANDRKTRDAAVDSLKNFLSASRQFEELELLKLWKGLYYCFWHSDRAHVQQALAKDLADLCLKVRVNNFIPFLRAFWTTMCREWKSIDVLRLDKFYTLLRRFIGAAFQRVYRANWQKDMTNLYIDLLEEIPLSATNQKMPNGIRYHIADIYVDELSKVVPEDDRPNVPIEILLRPFERLITRSPVKAVRLRVMKSVFDDETLTQYGYDSPIPSQPGQTGTTKSVDEDSDEDGNQSFDEDRSAEDVEFAGFD